MNKIEERKTVEYKSSDDIPDEVIKKAFASSPAVKFLAKNFNFVHYRYITFGGLGWWIPMKRVLLLVGITPQMLRPVFSPQRRMGEKIGELKEVELPEIIESYEQLGAFTRNVRPFQELAKVFGKPVEVFMRRDDSLEDLDNEHVATIHPSEK